MRKGYPGNRFRKKKNRKLNSTFRIISEIPRMRRGIIYFGLLIFLLLFFLGSKQFAKAQTRFKTDLNLKTSVLLF